MPAIAHIGSLMSAPWSAWVLLGLLVCAILSEVLQPGVISHASSSLLSQANRTYTGAPMNFMGQTIVSLFRIGSLAMVLYVCFDQGGEATFGRFAMIMGLITIVLLVKMLCNLLISYTFNLSRRFEAMTPHYGNLATLVCLALYPCLLVLLRLGNVTVSRWVFGALAVLFWLMLLYRMMKIYLRSFGALVYILLYVLTLEVLPMALILHICSKTLNSL